MINSSTYTTAHSSLSSPRRESLNPLLASKGTAHICHTDIHTGKMPVHNIYKLEMSIVSEKKSYLLPAFPATCG